MAAAIQAIRTLSSASIFGLALLTWSTAMFAQSLEPRAYANVPTGLNFLLAGAAYSDGGIPADPALPLENGNIEIQSGVLAFSRSFAFRGQSALARVSVPYVDLEGNASFSGEPRSRTTRGLGDAVVRFAWNFSGAPALKLKDYGDYRQDTIVGASLLVQVPTGSYDPTKLLNLGANRWAIKPEIGLSKALGRWIVEGSTSIFLFDDNDDFFGGQFKEQDPMYSMQAHIIRLFDRGLWASLDTTYYAGGRVTVDGDKLDTRQENWRVGATLAIPISKRNSIKIYASSGVYARIDSKFDLIGIGWQYRWGDGL